MIPILSIENTNYLVNTTQNKFILTIYEERIRDDLIPFYMDVMYNSCTNGIKCPTPIKDRNGQLINIIKKKSYGFFKFINGKSKKNGRKIIVMKQEKNQQNFIQLIKIL